MDLGEPEVLLPRGAVHDTLAGVGLAVAGAERRAPRGAVLGRGERLGLQGDRLHAAHQVQAVLLVLTGVCGAGQGGG